MASGKLRGTNNAWRVLPKTMDRKEERHLMNNEWDFNFEEELHEECGVIGMYDFDGRDVASTIYYGLFALQHRGQESC